MVDWWAEFGIWILLPMTVVSLSLGIFWEQLIEEPLAKRQVRKSLNQWTTQELKDHLAQRNSDDSP